ncbi:MAG: glycosyl hydrolase, partial [Anaerolineae bacterium]
AGLGGYVMHARGGLTIPYMGQQWVDSVKAMIEEGEALGMLSIVDDEYGWPSGFGAGQVNGKGKDYWLKWLRCKELPANQIKVTDQTLGIFHVAGNRAERVSPDSLTASDEMLTHIYYEMDRYYVDNMDPKVVQAFIEYSYEGYRREVGASFGKGLFGIFSDEPQLARYATPWSLILPGEFEKRFGYSLVNNLPAIFYEVAGNEQVRYHFWALVSDLFTNSYAKQIYDWCTKNNITFTGHTTLEENFYYQLQCSGNTLPFYEHMTIPGIDFLCRGKVNNLLCKQLSSVAEQLGKERILSEMYGCVGWNVSFEELKWIGEAHFVLGINLMLQHLGLYSLRGSRKREYPASLFYQQPWWKDYRPFNDYFARLSQLVTESQPLTQTLVIHPIKSAWITYNGNDPKATDALEASFTALTDTLLALNIDFHYGDETLLARHGRIKDGKLVLGNICYTTVIIPPCTTLDHTTIDLLEAFAQTNPSRLIAVGSFPTLVEGAPSPDLEALRKAAVPVGESLAQLEAALGPLVDRHILVERLDGQPNQWVYCTTRKLDGQNLYYVVNTAKDESCDIRLIANEQLLHLNLETCTQTTIDPSCIHLDGTQSLVLVGIGNHPVRAADTKARSAQTLTITNPWTLSHDDLNSLTLDYCDYALEDGVWQGRINMIELQQRLMQRATNGPVSMKFTFNSSFAPKEALYLVLENPETYTIELNGQVVDPTDCGWWIDRSFRKVDITGRVRAGENQIILRRNFYCSEHTYRIKNDHTVHEAESNRVTVETELESIYLLGSFAVEIGGEHNYIDRRALWADAKFVLSPLSSTVQLDNLTVQGYPFFAGQVKLSNTFMLPSLSPDERSILAFGRPDAVVSEVTINGQLAKTFMWAPYSVDITELCREGENTITLRLVNSCRNLLGPHHHSAGELYAVGQHSFLRHEGSWTDRYCLVRFGLEGSISVERSWLV